MLVRLYADPVALLDVAGPFFRSDPFSTSVIAGVTNRAAAGPAADSTHLWATIEDAHGEVLGLAMHTPPFPLFVSRMSSQAAAALAHALADTGREIPGVSGEREATTAFSASWREQTGRSSMVVTAMRMYRLGIPAPPKAVPGAPITAKAPGDIDLVAEWLSAFHQAAQPHAPSDNPRAVAQRRIAARELYLWRDEATPVSLAGVSAPTAGVARVAPVYTPEPFRRRGYGAAITAAATAAALDAGAEHVVLYTDLANPTSNSLYQAIGYQADHDAEQRLFSALAAPNAGLPGPLSSRKRS